MKNGRTFALMALMAMLASGLGAYILFGANSLASLVTAGGMDCDQTLDETSVEQLGTIEDQRLTEISGIDLSSTNRDSFWVHNDSGHPAEVYLINASGRTLATITLEGARNIDWEDLCVCQALGKSYVCVADVGDNNGVREKVQLYLFEEPAIQQVDDNPGGIELVIVDFIRLEFKYEDGPRNCEAIAFEATEPAFYLCEKRLDRSRSGNEFGIYRLRLNGDSEIQISGIARRVGQLADPYVTAMDFSGDSGALIVRNHVFACLFERTRGTTWATTLASVASRKILLPIERQGEAICFCGDDRHVMTVSEFGKSAIWKIDSGRLK